MTKTKVIQPEPPVEKTVLADAIIKISDGVSSLLKTGLNRDAVIVLLADRTGVGKRVIANVLDGMASLKKDYCK